MVKSTTKELKNRNQQYSRALAIPGTTSRDVSTTSSSPTSPPPLWQVRYLEKERTRHTTTTPSFYTFLILSKSFSLLSVSILCPHCLYTFSYPFSSAATSVFWLCNLALLDTTQLTLGSTSVTTTHRIVDHVVVDSTLVADYWIPPSSPPLPLHITLLAAC